MANEETVIMAKIRLDVSAKGWRLFRNSTGQAWQGKVKREIRTATGLEILLSDARRVVYGLVKGSSDLIGWEPVEITQDMVGEKIARFVAIEIKTKSYKKLTTEQENFLRQVAKAGGIAEVRRELANGEIEIKKILPDCLT